MNKEAILEIGNLIHVRRMFGENLTAKGITQTYEYRMFKKSYPKLCELAEGR